MGGGEEEEGVDAPINLRVKDGAGQELVFKVKKSTKMMKIFDAYAQRKGLGVNHLRFTLDGKRINGT